MRLIFIIASALIWTSQANASDDLLIGADEAYGEYLSSECLACHQPKGSEGIPTIVGLDALILAQKLHAYKNKSLENQVMQLVAGNLDDEQIASLSLYFSKLAQ